VLPTRKQVLASKRASRACEAKALSKSKKKVYGPQLPDGKFWSTGPPPEGDLAPVTDSDWNKKRDLGGNWQPVYLSLRILDSKTRRNLCRNPRRRFKERLAPGEHVVYPDSASVRVFQRRAWALMYVREAISSMHTLGDEYLLENIENLLDLLPEVFRCSPKRCSDYKSLNAQLRFHRRQKLRDQTRTHGPGGKL
jgi:hypothetical protein